MDLSGGRSDWLLPVVLALLTVGSGVAVNLATDKKDDFWAWMAVIGLGATIALVTALVARGRKPVMSRREITEPDGRKTVFIDIYSTEAAMQSLPEDSSEEGKP